MTGMLPASFGDEKGGFDTDICSASDVPQRELARLPFRVLSQKNVRRYLKINFTRRRYLKQSSLSLLKIMKTSVNVLL